MTNQQIAERMQDLILSERKITNEILKLINLAQDRKVHLERGYPSMFAWLVKGFGYSESAAYRRIEAAKLLRSVPEVESKLEQGIVNLTTICKANSVMRAQERISKTKIANSEKSSIVRKIEKQSMPEAERTLLKLYPAVAESPRNERISVVNQSASRLSVDLAPEVLDDLVRVRELLSHAIPYAEFAKVIAYLAKDFRKRNDPLLKIVREGNGS